LAAARRRDASRRDKAADSAGEGERPLQKHLAEAELEKAMLKDLAKGNL